MKYIPVTPIGTYFIGIFHNLKPIINGTGNYYLEAQTRDERRTDVIVDYLGEQFIVELKIWHATIVLPPTCISLTPTSFFLSKLKLSIYPLSLSLFYHLLTEMTIVFYKIKVKRHWKNMEKAKKQRKNKNIKKYKAAKWFLLWCCLTAFPSPFLSI